MVDGMKNLKKAAAFTLVELLVVLAIIALLLTLAVPRYFQSLDASKETILAENLRITRETIDKFYGDTGRYPESLEELVEKGNVFDIKSSAPGNNRQGVPYADL